MNATTLRRTLPLLGLTCLLTLASCAGSGGTLVQREKPQLTTRPDMATLVIVRPTSYGFALVIDNFVDGQLVGRTRGKSFNLVNVAPGRHYVMGRAENIAVARIDFEPGRLYFLVQGITPGVWKARTLYSTTTLEDALAKVDDPDCDYRVLDPNGEVRHLSREDFEEAARDFEQELVKDPARHRDTIGYRGHVLGGPAAVAGPPPAGPAPAPATGQRCSKDTDCPGNDVCTAGACIGPGAPQPAAAPPPPPPPPAASGLACGKDVDCPGNEVCNAGTCRAPR